MYFLPEGAANAEVSFVLKLMNFVLKMMNFALNIIVWKVNGAVVKSYDRSDFFGELALTDWLG